MAKNDKYPTDRIIIIDLGNLKYKIIIPIHISSKVPISMLADKKIQEKMAEDTCYNIGWWKGVLKKKGLILSEVEILFPQKGQYLELQENIASFYKEKGITVTVSAGVMIDIPNRDMSLCREKVHEQIHSFAKNTFNNN